MRARSLAPLFAAVGVLAACGTQDATGVDTQPSFSSHGGEKNAQSIMVALQPMGPFVIAGEEIWSFDHAAARAYFSNTLSTAPASVTCGGNSTNCGSSNRPATPAAPAPDAQKVHPVASTNSCTFYSGGALAVNQPHDAYTQSVTVNGVNGKGNWTFTWTYAVAPTQATVDPRTAWTMTSSTLTYPEATIAGFVAGQSVHTRTSGTWRHKASHTLADILSENGTRVTGLNARLTGPDAATTDYPLAVTLGSRDFVYTANAGTFGGAVSALFNGGHVTQIHNGMFAAANGGLDDHAGNNGLGAETAEITPVSFQMTTPGAYSLTVTGTVKGNSGSLAQPFSVSQNVSVQAGSCTQ